MGKSRTSQITVCISIANYFKNTWTMRERFDLNREIKMLLRKIFFADNREKKKKKKSVFTQKTKIEMMNFRF